MWVLMDIGYHSPQAMVRHTDFGDAADKALEKVYRAERGMA